MQRSITTHAIQALAMIGIMAVTPAIHAREGTSTRVPVCRITSSHGGMGPWSGGCRGGMAEGYGAVRIRINQGTGVFAGKASGGEPVSGMTELDDGGLVVTMKTPPSVPKGMDEAAVSTERAYDDAFLGAQSASDAYRRLGNHASSRFYAQLRLRLKRGQPE